MTSWHIETSALGEQTGKNRDPIMEETTMSLFWLDHVNIRTTNLDAMSAFYEDVLDLKRGKRPSFEFGGAWHYCGKHPVVHIVETAKKFKTDEAQVEHFAFRSNGTVKAFQKKMRDTDTPYNVVPLTEINMIQVNVFDPDGNKIEIQFAASEADTDPFNGSPAARRRARKGAALNVVGPMPLKKSKAKTIC